jgi:hypothetical protein
MQKQWILYGFAALTAVVIACGGDTKTPVSPTPAVSSDSAAAAADGSTMKISAPTPSSPANGSTTDSLTPNLVIQNATGKFVPQTVPYYQFVILSGSSTVYDSGLIGTGSGLTGHRVASGALKAETAYTWKARGMASATSYGPWSTTLSFTTPKAGGDGYQTATTLWDPLTNG